MTTMINLSTYQGNDTKILISVTQAPVSNVIPLNLAGLTLRFILKASQTATDASGTTYLAGTGVTVVNAALGQLSVAIPGSALSAAGALWWRLDIVTAGLTATALYGNLNILPV
jgi:hypothetical protein